jgi:hypothetical protein
MKEYPRFIYRIYPGGRTELVRRVPTGTVVLVDAGLAAKRLSEGRVVYVERDEWEDMWMDIPQQWEK